MYKQLVTGKHNTIHFVLATLTIMRLSPPKIHTLSFSSKLTLRETKQENILKGGIVRPVMIKIWNILKTTNQVVSTSAHHQLLFTSGTASMKNLITYSTMVHPGNKLGTAKKCLMNVGIYHG